MIQHSHCRHLVLVQIKLKDIRGLLFLAMGELVKSYEMWNCTTENLDHVVIVWKENDNHYQSRLSGRWAMAKPFDLDSLSTSETIPIPMHIFKGRWHPSLTESPPVAPTDSFLKRPCILLPDD